MPCHFTLLFVGYVCVFGEATGPIASAKTRWENHTYEYAQVPVGSPEYQAILEEGGWEMFDRDEKARIFRREKPKAPTGG